jgi:hypothetical protein
VLNNVNRGNEQIWSTYFGEGTLLCPQQKLETWLKPSRWSDPGRHLSFVWAEVRTRGSLRYKVWIDCVEKVSGCTCTVREGICVHRLALAILHQEDDLDFTELEGTPVWIKRVPDPPPSVSLSAKTRPADPFYPAESRMQELREGYLLLGQWLANQTQLGWQAFLHAPEMHAEELATRLVNYRLAGPARVIRSLINTDSRGPQLMPALREQLASLLLACRVMQSGPEGTDADTWRYFMLFSGVTLRKDYIHRLNHRTQGEWLVLHSVVSEETEDLRHRKTWLLNLSTGKAGYLLDFAWKRQPLAEHWPIGRRLEGTMFHYPGTGNDRLLPGEIQTIGDGYDANPSPASGWRDVLQAWMHQQSRNPWLEELPFLIEKIHVLEENHQFLVSDQFGEALPCATDAATPSYHKLDEHSAQVVFGELRNGICRPLSILYPHSVQVII